MTNKLLFLAAAMAAGFFPACAGAQEAPASPVIGSVAGPFAAATRIDNAALGTVTGRGDLAQVVNAQNKGVVTGNTVSGTSQTGTIRFDSSSFQNLNGLSVLSANTGNNVSINASLNVNVAISGR